MSDELINQRTQAVNVNCFLTDKISANLTNFKTGERYEIAVEPRGSKRKISTFVTLDTETLSADNEALRRVFDYLTTFDLDVMNALITVWECGQRVTTAQVIYRIMVHHSQARATTATAEKIISSVRKLARIQITICATQEREFYPQLDEISVQGALVATTISAGSVRGQKVNEVIHLLDLNKSPLYAYAKSKRAIATIPSEKLDRAQLASAGTMSERHRAIHNYLLHRVEAIPRLSNRVRVDTLLEACDLVPSNPKQVRKRRAQDIRSAVEILNGFIQTGYIKEFQIEYAGKSAKALIISKRANKWVR